MEQSQDPKKKSDFLDAAKHSEERGIVGEFVGFMRENKAWWLAPILIVLAFVGYLFAMAVTGGLPFIYTLF
jgi:Family of unknown function (DUF5989)